MVGLTFKVKSDHLLSISEIWIWPDPERMFKNIPAVGEPLWFKYQKEYDYSSENDVHS